jgi:hypothetical protein
MADGVEVNQVPHVQRAWWLRFPPSVDDAVLRHGRAVTWLAVAAMAVGSLLYALHDSVLRCTKTDRSECNFVGTHIDPLAQTIAGAAWLVAVPLLFLVYARWRHAIRRWDRAVPFEPRRRLLAMAVEDGDLAAREYDRLVEAYRELLSGQTLGERLRIRADFLWAWAAVLSAAGAIALIALLAGFSRLGGADAMVFVLVVLFIGALAALGIVSARRVSALAWDAARWELHTARGLLDRALKKLKIDPPRP